MDRTLPDIAIGYRRLSNQFAFPFKEVELLLRVCFNYRYRMPEYAGSKGFTFHQTYKPLLGIEKVRKYKNSLLVVILEPMILVNHIFSYTPMLRFVVLSHVVVGGKFW